jgi:hypothetical protein
VAAIDAGPTTLTGTGESEELDAARVTGQFFALLGVSPSPGRSFTDADDRPGGNLVAVISHALWVRKFGSDPSIVGRPVTLDGASVTIVGVLPAQAAIPGPQQLGDLVRRPKTNDVLRPAEFRADELRSPGDLDYGVIGRVRPGTPPEALRAELDALEPAISAQTEDDGRKRAVVQPLQAVIVRNARGPLLVLLAATAAVLLIVCVNLTNLLLARHAGRRRDAAIRTALGGWPAAADRRIAVRERLLAIGRRGARHGDRACATRIIEGDSRRLPQLNMPRFDARCLRSRLAPRSRPGSSAGALPRCATRPRSQPTRSEPAATPRPKAGAAASCVERSLRRRRRSASRFSSRPGC